MPVALTETPTLPAALHPSRKRWTRSECAAFENASLWAGQHLELIEGDLINKNEFRREQPIGVAPEDHPTSEPEPDVIVLARWSDEFRREQPRPQDVALLVEIAESVTAYSENERLAPLAAPATQVPVGDLLH